MSGQVECGSSTLSLSVDLIGHGDGNLRIKGKGIARKDDTNLESW
jgi:hypothetical protein